MNRQQEEVSAKVRTDFGLAGWRDRPNCGAGAGGAGASYCAIAELSVSVLCARARIHEGACVHDCDVIEAHE